MRLTILLAAALAAACTQLAPRTTAPEAAGTAAAAPQIAIPFEKHVLDNGLTVVLHEDHKAPIVSVNVWYHVGSKDEKPGRTGFAHLFEHLMFQGTENYPDEFFKPLERVGATTMNGTTNFDRTNYYENVPSTALDLALWMESDRMGHFIDFVDQALLDEQRGVVQNEKRQGENQPYGKVFEALTKMVFPAGHPYSWLPIGSMEDLNAATLDDVREWFARYYGAANATLVIAGDIDPAETLAKVKRYFGDIPAGPPVAHRKQWIAKRTESSREVMQDRVAQTRILRVWNVPPIGDTEAEALQLGARVLGGGKTSRLYKALVYDRKLVDSVSAAVHGFELAGLFVVSADVKRDADPAEVEGIIAAEMQRFIDEGPTAEELRRAATEMEAAFVRGIERVGGWGSKSDVLASNEVYLGDPGAWRESLQRIRRATPEAVRASAHRWLSSGDHTLAVVPFGEYRTTDSDVDRSSGPPEITEFPTLNFPRIERATLSNGMKLVLARREQTPLVEIQLMFDAGYAADAGTLAGTASMTMAMLDEGTPSRSALQIAAEAEELGANISAGASLDSSTVSLSALSARLPESLDLFADIVRHPLFDANEYARVQATWLAGIAQEKTRPVSVALRNLPPLLYGPDHPYGIPFTGSGTEQSIRALTPEALRAFHARWLRPDNATVIVAGDTTLEQITAELERVFGDWQAPAEPLPVKSLPTVELPEGPRVYLLNRSDAEQSLILAGHLAPSSADPRHLLFSTVNEIIGGSFTARINMNLREDKHWSYGARSFAPDAVGQRPFMVYAPVQTDRTADSVKELLRELRDYVGERPAEPEELAKVKAARIRSLPGKYETNGAVLGALYEIVRYQRPDNYVEQLKPRIEAQSLGDVRRYAREVLHPERMTWLIVGDLSRIEAPIRALDIGPVTVLDPDELP